MSVAMYPPDGGLKEPKRPLDPGYVFRVIRDHFREQAMQEAQGELEFTPG